MPDISLISNSFTFRKLDTALLQRLLDAGEIKTCIDGDYIFKAGQEYTKEIYIVIEGEVIIQREDGQAYSVGAGDFVGLSSYLDHAPYSSSALVRDRVELLVLSDEAFESVRDEYPGISTAVNRSLARRIRRWNPGRRGTTGILIQPVRSVMTVPFASCAPDTTLREALEQMARRNIGSLGVLDSRGDLKGITTHRLIAESVLLKKADPEETLADAGTEDVHTIGPEEQLWKAEKLQDEFRVKYLAVVENGVPVGMLSQTDIIKSLRIQSQRNLLTGIAAEAESIEKLKELFGQLDGVARGALEYNRRAATAIRILSETHLTINRRCVELTLREMKDEGEGDPPVRFAVVIMGSGGRKEMMLEPDQDNGLIMADSPRSEEEDAQEWFIKFGKKLNHNLDEIGYPLCTGDIMVMNPVFTKSISAWKKQISYMAEFPTEKAARWSNVTFDFDTLYGDDSLTVELWRHLHGELKKKPRLLSMMVEDDAEGRPPIGFFNRLITSDRKESRGKIDVKRNGLRIIADAARIYGLSRGISANNTHDRINALVRLEVLDGDFADSILSAYDELIDMVLDHQLDQMSRGEAPDKLIDPEKITPHQREVLRDSMLAIKRFQEKLQGDFAR
jgi:CBS domain-containing protein